MLNSSEEKELDYYLSSSSFSSPFAPKGVGELKYQNINNTNYYELYKKKLDIDTNKNQNRAKIYSRGSYKISNRKVLDMKEYMRNYYLTHRKSKCKYIPMPRKEDIITIPENSVNVVIN